MATTMQWYPYVFVCLDRSRFSLTYSPAQRCRIMKNVPEYNDGRTVQTKGVVEASETVIRVGLALRQTIRKWTGVS